MDGIQTKNSNSNTEESPALTLLRASTSAGLELIARMESCESLKVSFSRSVEIMLRTVEARGKIVWVGCGKSFKLCDKVSCMLNSLGVASAKMHPIEALHGDIGMVDFTRDCLVFVSTSGETEEINDLIYYIQKEFASAAGDDYNTPPPPPPPLSMVGVTHFGKSTMASLIHAHSPVAAEDPHKAILEVLDGNTTAFTETAVFPGLKAPTVSLSVTLQLLDALVIELVYKLHGGDWASVVSRFGRNHPNGIIGQHSQLQSFKNSSKDSNKKKYDIGMYW